MSQVPEIAMTDRKPKETETITNQLSSLEESLSELHKRAYNLRDRLLGCQPCGDCGEDCDKPANGTMSYIQNKISAVQSISNEIAYVLSELEEL